MRLKLRIHKIIINLLFSENKKMAICLAIDSRIEELEKLRVQDKTVDYFNISFDISELKDIRQLYSTNLYN